MSGQLVCAHQWADETSDEHACHLLAGHAGWHECGEDVECDATECCAECSTQLSDGSGPEPDDSDRVPPVPGDHDTTSAPRTAGVDVSAAIRAPYSGGAR